MRLDSDTAALLASDEGLWRDFNDICDTGGIHGFSAPFAQLARELTGDRLPEQGVSGVLGDAVVGLTTTNDDVLLQAGGAVAFNEAVSVGTADLRIVAGGAVTQLATGAVTADEFGLRATGALRDRLRLPRSWPLDRSPRARATFLGLFG